MANLHSFLESDPSALTPPFLVSLPRLYVDSTIDTTPAEETWQTNSLILPPKFRGGARSCIAILRLPHGKLFSARCRGTMKVRVDPPSDMFSLHLSVGGRYRFECRHGAVCSHPNLLILPDAVFTGSSQNLSLLFVDLSRHTVERALGAAWSGKCGLQVLPAPHDTNLRSLAFAAAKQAESVPTHLRPLFLRNFENLMASALAALLAGFLPEDRRPAPMIGRRQVAAVREWAAAEHEQPLTVGDLARHCGLGPRALQKNFLRHFDTTPRQFLHQLRLRKARGLLADQAAGWSVTAAALEAGFVHLGRFAASYHDAFGELPSATVSRRDTCRRPFGRRHAQDSPGG